jgi:hypothetical protein
MTEVTVLRTVPVSDDGITTRTIVAGTDDKVASDLFPGLEAEGYVTALAAPEENKSSIIPQGWRDLHHFKLVALAKALGSDVSTKADAIAVIEAAEKAAQA